MRFIQVFNQYLQPGGEEKSVDRIARHIEIGGHEVFRFWRSSREWTDRGGPSIFQQPFLLWDNPRILAELRVLHEQVKPDAWILHNLLPVISLGVYRLAKTLGVPIIRWLHNYRPISPSGTLVAFGRIMRPDERFIRLRETLQGTYNGRLATAWLSLCYTRMWRRTEFSQVKAWIALSDYMKCLVERSCWPLRPTFVLRHSWDVQPKPAAQTDCGYFLFLGRMVESKGVQFVVDLWRRPEMRHHRLIMAGKGPLADKLARQSSPNITWVGHVDGARKDELLNESRAVIFPCVWPEPLGLVVYEAYQACKPVLASDLGGLRETVSHNRTGMMIPAGHMDAWSAGVNRLASDAALATRMGIAGRQWLEREASPESWLRGFEAVLDEVYRRYLHAKAA